MRARVAEARRVCGVLALIGLVAGTVWGAGDDTPTYIVRHVDVAPVIDGILTTPDEWLAADPALGEWMLLRSGINNRNDVPDETNNRFIALWSDDGLYLQHQVDYGFWDQRGYGAIDWNYENLNLYFDPNMDGETNELTSPSDTGVDGYQLTFNQPLGMTEWIDVGTFVEAHVNAAFGDQGAPWSRFQNVAMKQTTSADPDFGYTELFIPWADFDATNPDAGSYTDTGLYHPYAPLDGETWFFNIARNEDGYTLPAWVAAPGRSLFAQRPHGVLVFSMGATAGDFNGDGLLTSDDIDLLTPAVAIGGNDPNPLFDVNGDEAVNAQDIDVWVKDLAKTWIGDANLDGVFDSNDFIQVFSVGKYELPELAVWSEGDWNGDGLFSSGDFVAAFSDGGYELGPRPAAVSAVPEPAGWLLLLMALTGLAARRRV